MSILYASLLYRCVPIFKNKTTHGTYTPILMLIDFKGIKIFNPVHCHIINFRLQKLAAIQNYFLSDSKTIEPFNRLNIQRVFKVFGLKFT